MDTTLSIKVPGTVVPYVIHLASKNCTSEGVVAMMPRSSFMYRAYINDRLKVLWL